MGSRVDGFALKPRIQNWINKRIPVLQEGSEKGRKRPKADNTRRTRNKIRVSIVNVEEIL
jgi:hypothetical protein